MRKSSCRILPLIFAVLIIPVLVACGKPELTEPEYAGAMAETLLQALNDGSFTDFVQNFDETLKPNMTADGFEETRADIQGTFGDYVSKVFSGVEKVELGVIAVSYNATFTKRPETTVKIAFVEKGDAASVVGIFIQ
jgi:hypothetical protein